MSVLVDIMDMKETKYLPHVTFNGFHGRGFLILTHFVTLVQAEVFSIHLVADRSLFSSHLPCYSRLSCLWNFCPSPQMVTIDNHRFPLIAQPPCAPYTQECLVPSGCRGYCVFSKCFSAFSTEYIMYVWLFMLIVEFNLQICCWPLSCSNFTQKTSIHYNIKNNHRALKLHICSHFR